MKSVCLLAMLVVAFFSTASFAEDPYLKFYELYRRVADLALQGVDVGELVKLLNSALDLLESGELGEASRVLSELEWMVSELEEEASAIVLEKSIAKYATVAALLSFPVAVYLLLPRAYLYLWYSSRRRWLVTYERSR
ncbi:MAG: hypothetical protein RMH84_07200 [Sulfolobales archaeon]|nr:hypothetical protein [Sulfolobales archaeon]MDW8011359.1 hypothetical protein [Sulfolobales archaeon]